MKVFYLICLGVILSFLIFGCAGDKQEADTEKIEPQFENYDQLQDAVNEMEKNEKYQQAIELMQDKFDKFPDYEYEIIKELTYLYTKTEEFDNCRELWQRGHEKNMFFGLFKGMPYFKPFENKAWFDTLSENDMKLRATALEKSKTFYEVITPQNYDSSKIYPLMIVLHGGGSTIERAKKNWVSAKLESECIVAFFQSYLHYGMKEFGWKKKDTKAAEEVKAGFDEIITAYPVDESKIYIGGVSAGGSASMDFIAMGIIPAAGYLGVCPVLSGDRYEPSELEQIKATKASCYIVSGQNDFSLDGQTAFIKLIRRMKIKNEFIIIPGLGHDYPENFSDFIDKALAFFQS